MSEDSSKESGKFLSLLVLTASLIIAIAALWVMLSNWGDRGSHPLALGLSVGVLLVILLIVFMMSRIALGMRKERGEDHVHDSYPDDYE